LSRGDDHDRDADDHRDTTDAATFAQRLGLDCGLVVTSVDRGGSALAIAAWTGPRIAFAVQMTQAPTSPFATDAYVNNPVTEEPGESLENHGLGAAAKEWDGNPPQPFVDEVNPPAEEHAIDVLAAAGMRNIGIAQPPEFGSEEGYVQFISPTGQISVVDVAPSGWFDPMTPRYFTGETTVETANGVDIRVTLPDTDDGLGRAQDVEVAFACSEFVWILEPSFNGTVDEMLATARAIVMTPDC